MEKKIWSTPGARVEEFVTNEYCSTVCFQIACYWGAQDPNDSWGTGTIWGDGVRDFENNKHQMEPGGSGCGHADNQFIQQSSPDENGNYFYTVVEKNTAWGDLDCKLYKQESTWDADDLDAESNWTTEVDSWDSTLADSSWVYWATWVGNKWMKHFGQVNLSGRTSLHSS